MRERPILFSGPMVRALLAGMKTQTRREVCDRHFGAPKEWTEYVRREHDGSEVYVGFGWDSDQPRNVQRESWRGVCPYGQPGDRLWVREDHHITLRDMRAVRVRYLADESVVEEITIGEREYDLFTARKRPLATTRGRFMWRCLSRLDLELVGVRIERLNAISDADAIAEGVDIFADGAGYTVPLPNGELGAWQRNPIDAYRNLWEVLHGAGSWATNPWVWVPEFRRVQP